MTITSLSTLSEDDENEEVSISLSYLTPRKESFISDDYETASNVTNHQPKRVKFCNYNEEEGSYV